ncbi:MAG: hypothetical protein V2A34_04200, partial [Lentisphaerota bacterium]
MRLVNGKLVPVEAGPDTSAPEAPAATAVTPPAMPTSEATPVAPRVSSTGISLSTATGQGRDAYIQGSTDPKQSINEQSLWIKAGLNAKVATARKAYIRFDLAGLNLSKLTDAFLTLTAAQSSKNKTDGRYELLLWGLKDEAAAMHWAENASQVDAPLLDWFNAPGNNPDSAGGMSPNAMLLATIHVKANYNPGETIAFANAHSPQPNALRDYIQVRAGKTATFIITANDASEQKAGWKFASKENGNLAPPTLFLRGAVTQP